MEKYTGPILTSTQERPMTPEDAVEAGIKFGARYRKVAVVRDADPTSETVAAALISGLLSAGAEVLYAGEGAVPVAHATAGSECGLMLAVGNPDKDGRVCGICPYEFDGSPMPPDAVAEILDKENAGLPAYKDVGRITEVADSDRKYIERIKNSGVSSQGYVVVDCGCGSTSSCAPQLLERIGADVIAFNSHKAVGRPPRSPDLGKTNLMNVSNFVNAIIGSIGIAFNGDGTRIALIDESGKYVPGDRLLALMLMYLEPAVAVVPFDSPCVVEDAFDSPLGLRNVHTEQEDRKLVRAEGNIYSVIAAMKENNADFGGLNDGTFIFPQFGFCPDALYAAAILSELAGKRSIRNVLESIPVYSNRTIRIPFDGNIVLFANKLKERIKNYDVDRVDTLGNSWKVVLAHGTYTIKQNPAYPDKLIIFAESSDVVYLITMLEQAKDIVKYCI